MPTDFNQTKNPTVTKVTYHCKYTVPKRFLLSVIMNNPAQKVFILNILLKYRILFGYYHNVSRCGYKRFLLKVITVLIATAILCISIKCPLLEQGDVIWVTKPFEYISYVICALITENCYLINYLNADILNYNLFSKNIYHKINKFIIQYIVFLHILYTILSVLYYLFTDYTCNSWVFFSVWIYLCLANDLGFMPVNLILFFFYLRISFLCIKIRKEAVYLNNTFNWKKYVNLYIEHIDSLEKTAWPMKFMMFLQLSVSFIEISKTQFDVVQFYKNNALNNVSSFYLCLFVIYIIYVYTKVFCPAIIMELILQELDNLKIEIADKMITCTDERRKEQLHEMLTRFHTRPLTYTIWRALRVDSRLPLGFFSLSITCLLCLLQFNHVLEK